MSLILDALNRADRERKNSQPTPDINTIHEVSYHPSHGQLPRVWIVGAAILIAILIVLLYLLLQARQGNSTLTPAPIIEVPAPVVAPVVDAPVQQSLAEEPPSPAPEPAAVDRPAQPSPEVHSLYAESGRSAPAVDEKINDLYKPVEEAPTVTSTPVQVPEVTSVSLLDKRPEKAPQTSGRNYDSISNIPDLRQLPWSLQQEIPSIIYSQHNFTGDGASNVVLNGQARRTGNQVGGQLNLEEIYVDGILLRFREHRFKLRALNNWVNM